MAKLAVLGAGGFGTALAVMAKKYCLDSVCMWTPFEEEARLLDRDRVHEKLLKGIEIPKGIEITTDLSCAAGASLVVLATPSFAVGSTCEKLAAVLPEDVPVACVSKGLDTETLRPLSDIMERRLPRNPSVMLSGPSHAEEVARGIATTVVAASRSRDAAEFVQDFLMNESFRIYVNDDVLGVELGGALKNIIALAAGVVDGLGIGGDNTKAALMTRGITEIARLGVALGAKSETFAGLSGIGDLIVTCSSMHSRNRRCGILIGQGVPPHQAVEQIGMTVEGYPCTKTAYRLSQKHKIYMPIVTEVYQVLYGNKEPAQVVKDLMALPKRHESETIWLLSR